MSASLDTSVTSVSTLWNDGTSCLSFAAARSRAGAEISAKRTLAPSFAKRIEVSRPIPLEIMLVENPFEHDNKIDEIMTCKEPKNKVHLMSNCGGDAELSAKMEAVRYK